MKESSEQSVWKKKMETLKIVISIVSLIYVFNVPCTIAYVEFGYVYHSKKIGKTIMSFENITSQDFCLVKCINYEICRSINYNEEKEICEIADQNEVKENLEEAAGWINIQKGKNAIRIVNNKTNQCMLPENGDCNINDGTTLVLKERNKCNHISAFFEFDKDAGTIIHQCSQKQLCHDTRDEKLVALKSKCDEPEENNFAIRSWHNTIQVGRKCLIQLLDKAKLSECSLDELQNGMMFDELEPPSSVNVEIFNGSTTLDFDTFLRRNFSDPLENGYLDSMTSLANIYDNYEVIIWTYFSPPVSGTYQFAILGNDKVRLTVADVNNMTTPLLEIYLLELSIDRLKFESSKKSEDIVLEKNKKYKLHALLLESVLTDFMTIGIKLPRRSHFERIKSEYLQSKL